MITTRRDRKLNKKRQKRRRIIKTTGIVFLLFFLTVGIYVGYLYLKAKDVVSNSFEEDGRGNKSALREEDVDPVTDNVSVLIIGVDESKERSNIGSYRSDTLILATLNKNDHTVKLLSIPRDSYVYIPEKGRKDKINHAYAYGQTKATIETVEHLLEIPVDYYVKVNFEAFIDVVDSIGGITVNVPYEFTEQDSKDVPNAIHLYPGIQELNGEEALALARTRKLDNDIERGKRQQEIIKAIVNKAVSLGAVFKYGDVIDAVGENMRTNMTFKEMKSFISYGMDGKLQLESLSLDGSDGWMDGIYYYILDESSLEEVKQTLKLHLEL